MSYVRISNFSPNVALTAPLPQSRQISTKTLTSRASDTHSRVLMSILLKWFWMWPLTFLHRCTYSVSVVILLNNSVIRTSCSSVRCKNSCSKLSANVALHFSQFFHFKYINKPIELLTVLNSHTTGANSKFKFRMTAWLQQNNNK